MVDRLGRRPLFLISSVGMLISFILISGLSGGFAATGARSAAVAFVPFFTPLVISYPAEIWPYELRARGLAVMQLSTYSAIFFNTFVNPIALEAIGWKYYIVSIVILVVITVTIFFFYPETKGHSLEEIAVVFDKEMAAVTGNETSKAVLSADHKEDA